MKKEDKAVLSTLIEMFKSFQANYPLQPRFQYDPMATVSITGLNSHLYNSIFIKRPTDQLKLLDELRSFQKKLNKPLTLWLTAETEAVGFEKKLSEQFESPGAFYGMLLDLKNSQLSSIPENITIESVSSPQAADTFAGIFCESFHLEPLFNAVKEWIITQYESNTPTSLNYIAKLDGINAGVSSLVIDTDFKEFKTGGFYNACVLPNYRKQGIATAMACYRASAAKKLGLEYLSIILMSDAMARGYCEKLGFKNYSTMTPFFLN